MNTNPNPKLERKRDMATWQSDCAAARDNIVKLAKGYNIDLLELASNACVSADNLYRFVNGGDGLTYTEMQRVCRNLQIPIWAVHLPNLYVDDFDPILENVDRLIRMVPQMEPAKRTW